jgi:membrane-bound lytic murein transglycosylase D
MGNTHSTGRACGRETSGNWRLAAFGTGCTVIGGACVLLAACGTNPGKPSWSQALPDSTTPSAPELLLADRLTESANVSNSSPPWARLRQGFALQDCDYNAQVTQWSRRFSRDAAGFAASLSQSMPFLLVVAAEVEKRGMPAEFVFLPYIESNYAALASSGDRAAGIWQLMPDTAREAGLTITRDYDGRLDIAASTTAALDLLERYHEEFGDWRLADMAFNAGEYGIKDLRGNNSDAPSPDELARLRAPAHTHEHLAKLLAVSCVVAEPERFHVELPESQPEDELALLDLPGPVDLGLIARIAGIEPAQIKRVNPAYPAGRMPEHGPGHLLLPAAHRDRVAAVLDKLPRSAWAQWHEIALQHDEDFGVLAAAHGVDVETLRAVNAIAGDAVPAGTRLLVPGRADNSRAQATIARVETLIEHSATHIVHTGDTLWSIARSAGVRLVDLLSWNGLHQDATLHLGQRLRLHAPEGASSTASVSAP